MKRLRIALALTLVIALALSFTVVSVAENDDELPEVHIIVLRTPEPEPVEEVTPEPEPVVEETPEPEPVVEETPASDYDVAEQMWNAMANSGSTLRSDALSADQARDDGFEPCVLGNAQLLRSSIYAIEFADVTYAAGSDAWDVSEAQNGSVLAWTTDEAEGKKLTIASVGGVVAPQNARYLFAKYTNLKTIAFNGCFHTGKTTDMAGMFYGCTALKEMDIGGFDTGSVTDMSEMFYNCRHLKKLDLSGAGSAAQAHSSFNACGVLVSQEKISFDTCRVADMRRMFCDCKRLEQITVGDGFALVDMDESLTGDMFDNCPAKVVRDGDSLSADKWLKQAMVASGMEKGSDGDAVKWLQRCLKQLGYLSGSVDGDYGNQTEKAIQSFQADHGFEQSGVADAQTLRILCDEAAGVVEDRPRKGDILTFGRYEQDGDASDGTEPLEWIVLESDGKVATMISRYGLDAVAYNESEAETTWEKSSLRKWLNEDFMNAAFSADEQKRLQTVTVSADKNPESNADSGKDAKDKVYLASIDDINRWVDAVKDWACVPTQQALNSGVQVNPLTGVCGWWLRTPGASGDLAAGVDNEGFLNYDGSYVSDSIEAVRPVITIRIAKESESTSNKTSGKKRKNPKPKPKPGPIS